jgi:hypothetical protein
MPAAFQGLRPLGHHRGELAGVFIVASHFHASLSTAALQVGRCALGNLLVGCWLLFLRGRRGRSGLLEQFEFMARVIMRTKPRRTKENDRVLNALAAEPRQRLRVLGDDAHQPAVGTVDKGRVLVGEGSAMEVGRCAGFRLHAFKRRIRGSVRLRQSRSTD